MKHTRDVYSAEAVRLELHLTLPKVRYDTVEIVVH